MAHGAAPMKDWFDFARDPASGTEAVEAQFHAHAYDPHFHDQVLVGVTEQGLQQFRCRRETQRSTPGRVILMEPGETHDGEAGGADGFTYAMLYFDPVWLRQAAETCLGHDAGEAVFRFPRILNDDPVLAQAILAACAQMKTPDSRMAREAALDAVAVLLARRFTDEASPARDHAPHLARRAREAIVAHGTEDLGLQALAEMAGTDRFRLHRVFKAAYGIAPHAWLVQHRLNHARKLLSDGLAPADVAAAVGFADQSHLGRWFRRAYGQTPAAYRRACTNLPDAVAP